jgi:hypothetical protein
MSFFFLALGGVFALLTLATLMVGVVGMGKGGAFNEKFGNKLMQFRVLFQACAIGCFVLFLVTR